MTSSIRNFGVKVALVIGCILLAPAAWAHPHVAVTAKAEVLYAPDGKVTGIRHTWIFDEAYSAYVTQGLDLNGDGELTSDELQDLANENASALAEFDYFTQMKANGAKQVFDAPREPRMSFTHQELTLTFLLPVKAPANASKSLMLEVFDPTYFVAFTIATGNDAVKLAGAPKGCVATIARPKTFGVAQQQQNLSEAFFQALSAASTFGVQFASQAVVACP